jgi:hypothetical protein
MTKGMSNPATNGYKWCPKCETTKPLSEFYPANTPDGVRSPCKQCNRLGNKDRYEQEGSVGKTKNALRLEARLALKRQLVDAAGGCCVHCGYKRSLSALDFHHTGKDKEHEMADLLNGVHLSRALAEAAKCVLLCANCHRELHAGEWEL